VAKVVVVGSTNTDMTVRVPRFPGRGETILGHDFRTTAGGKGANQAVAAARAGGAVVFLTALGTDPFGDRALENLVRENIDVGLIRRVPAAASGVALIFVDDAGENSIAVAPGANRELSPADVAPLGDILEPGDAVLLQLEIPLDTVEAAADLAVKRRARVILNPAPATALPDSLLATVSLLTPNEAEAKHLSSIAVSDAAGLTRAAGILRQRGARDVLITLGARGVFASLDGAAELIPAFSVAAVDTTAAGDVFNGSLAVALVDGQPPRGAIRFASAAAALSVMKPGAQASAPARAEIEAFLRER
jgi:ribokinase